MQRILRAARYDAQSSVLIGEAPAVEQERSRSRLHRPPPPLPPPVDGAENPYAAELDVVSALAHSSAPWATAPTWGDEDAPPGAAEAAAGPHPAEEEALQKLADAERLLAQAAEEAATLRAQAEAEVEAMRADALEDVARAHAEAAQVRQGASDDADLIRQEATEAARELGYAEGHDQGYQEGIARAEAEMAERVAAVAALAESAAVDRRELLRNAEGEVVRLAIQIARKVLNRELRLDPASVSAIAEAALQQVAIDGQIKLRVNPTDHETLAQYWRRAHGTAEADRTYEVVADEAVAPGGVVIDTRAGTVDAQIETQLEEISQKVFAEQTGA